MSRKIIKPEVEATANDGTRYRVRYHKQNEEYIVEARNDKAGVLDYNLFGSKLIKRAWVSLYTDRCYSEALTYLFDALREYDAVAYPDRRYMTCYECGDCPQCEAIRP